MARNANIKTLEIVQDSKNALTRFGEDVRVALSMARSDMQRLINRLQFEETNRWKQHVRKWNKKLAEAKTDLYRAQIQMQDSRERPIEQVRAVERAQHNVDEGQRKLERIKYWLRELDRQMLLCKGQLQSLDQAVEVDLPRAAARLEHVMDSLQAYISLSTPQPITGEADSNSVGIASKPAADTPRTDEDERHLPAFILDASRRKSVSDVSADVVLSASNWSISPDDADRLAKLDVPIDPPFPEDRIIIAVEAIASEDIALHRTSDTPSGDSGWLIVPADLKQPPDRCVAVSFLDLSKAQPLLESAMILPRGSLILITRGRIVDTVDKGGRSLWSQADRA